MNRQMDTCRPFNVDGYGDGENGWSGNSYYTDKYFYEFSDEANLSNGSIGSGVYGFSNGNGKSFDIIKIFKR